MRLFDFAGHGYTHEPRTDFFGRSEFGGGTGAPDPERDVRSPRLHGGGSPHVRRQLEYVRVPRQTTLLSAFDETYANGGVYVQMLHHPTFTTGPNASTASSRTLDRLRSFVRYAAEHDVKFMTVGAFGEA